MSIFAISDLHLSFNTEKPMDVFGKKWESYVEKLKKNWNSAVTADDYVIVPGDISWATYLDETSKDFEYINSLNGKKIILKGNHDFWWTTVSKMNKYMLENSFEKIFFIQNNAYLAGDVAVCGTRGWVLANEGSSELNKKIFEREKLRLILSLEEAKKRNPKEIIAAMHYPPVEKENPNRDFINIMKEFNVKKCIYGHLHAQSQKNAVVGEVDGVDLKLVSCDYLDFMPCKLI